MSEPTVSEPREVAFPAGQSASTLLLRLLAEARVAFPEIWAPVKLPRRARDLKRMLPRVLVELEQRRVASAARASLARHLHHAAARALTHGPEGRPLAELRLGAEPFEIDALDASGSAGWRPRVMDRGRAYAGAALGEMVDALWNSHHLSPAAVATVRHALGRLDDDGALHLEGERFVLLGGAAEIAPTALLLEAGATVLYCDVVPPPPWLYGRAGRLFHARGRSDLLAAPDRVAATVAAFAEDGPVHLGLFAYGPGRGREWRLGAAMNAVARALPPESLRSVGLYVSPTTPAIVSNEDARVAERRLHERPLWQRSLLAAGLIVENRSLAGLPRIADTVVPLQGVSYQAAQWIEKTLAMEALAAERPGLRISANVAPITETRSLEHPLFAAAFRGAPLFGVRAFPPKITRTLSALAYIEDVTGAEPPSREARQIHGGLFAIPFALDGAIQIAAVRGLMARRQREPTADATSRAPG